MTGVAGLALCGTIRASNIVADSVNASLAADNGAYWGSYDVGWLYTPASSYDLSGINTKFSIPNGTTIQDRTVTAVLYQGNTPANGGTLLGSFQFNSSLADNQTLGGGTFSAPIPLSAGQQYFVGFMNVGEIPASSPPNTNAVGVNFTADASGVFLSDLFFDDTRNATCATTTTFACEDTNRDILGQPILQFLTPQSVSATPEPGALWLVIAGGALLGCVVRRRAPAKV